MLHYHRKWQQEMAAAEAAGENLWTDVFVETARIRLVAAVSNWTKHQPEKIARAVHLLFKSQLGIETGFERDFGNLLRYLQTHCEDKYMPSLIEAIAWALHHFEPDVEGFEPTVNSILNDHRISYELVGEEMVEFESQELHQEIVAPTLRLLSGRSGWEAVEAGYQTSLKEISQDNPSDAITDAGTALQEALQLFGCDGNSLGPLIKSATKKGLLSPYDVKLTEWVSADRSQMGDSHKAGSSATREDAWLTVHVVGALILRLAGGPPRSAGQA